MASHLIDGTTYVTHEDPVWRSEENYMGMVDLVPFGMANSLEQLWLRPTDGESYVVSCIPFFAYGLALGDTVILRDGRFVTSVHGRSGRRALRVMFTESPEVSQLCSMLRDMLISHELMSEWNGDRHVAVDVTDSSVVMSPVFDAVEPMVRRGAAFWEWSDARTLDGSLPQ
ncbi:DUF4265 domain-containing protein [Streptomyces sp. NPDC048389]|uniref:DUF4265 domain-containing protein n=1 Tax=Streptomyces sp. NPDC048389 TaxID=3154622 RepID=UPI003451F629